MIYLIDFLDPLLKHSQDIWALTVKLQIILLSTKFNQVKK